MGLLSQVASLEQHRTGHGHFSGCSAGMLSALLLHLGAEIGAHRSLVALAEYLAINQGNVGISAKELQCLICTSYIFVR